MFEQIGEGHKIISEGVKPDIDLEELERLAQKPIRTLDELIILAYAVPELIKRIRELEAELEVYREEKQLKWKRNRDEYDINYY